ncbi:hypothetical protein M758_UG300800 [Ceratodon purpureus]|nr:hypothetical protein M758_UG300800 [Ceratodon purpureus]
MSNRMLLVVSTNLIIGTLAFQSTRVRGNTINMLYSTSSNSSRICSSWSLRSNNTCCKHSNSVILLPLCPGPVEHLTPTLHQIPKIFPKTLSPFLGNTAG